MNYQYIKTLRLAKQLSQQALADWIKVSRTTYIAIENGTRPLNIDEVQKLAELFEVSLEELVKGKKNNPLEVIIKDSNDLNENSAIPNSSMRIILKNTDIQKFKEVILYVLEKIGGKSNVGETVLYKLLYFIDFDYYEKFEEQITGATYIKNHHGPTPIDFKVVIDKMIKNNELEKVTSKFFNYNQKKYLPHRKPDLTVLTARELDHIDTVLAKLSDKTAKELSDYSHGDVPWKIHKQGEKIDYESVFYRDELYSVRSYGDDI